MRMRERVIRNGFLLILILASLYVLAPPQLRAQASMGPKIIVVDARAPSHPFPHFWEKMFGSGRAILTLRDAYRRDLREVQPITGFHYVRFHGILNDEVGIYDEDSQGQPIYNFSYVDQIYDGLLANGVRPFVELSIMPKKLAAKEILHPFWYRPNVSPPKDWDKWNQLMAAFAHHLVDRYGIEEVRQWYFEVWNEPNLDFWAGEPKQATYWQLYDHTARALKNIDSKIRVGGPATAQAAWVDAFIEHCAKNHVPVDFVSTHIYADDPPADVFGTKEEIPRDQMVCRAFRKVHDQIKASAMPNLPLIGSEFNATFRTQSDITDSAFMGPWLADTIRQCDGLTDMMSYWTFSDVFEEQGVVKTPFYGGYGLIATGGIPKPAYNAFKLLHKLGDQRITLDSDSALLTRRADGTLVLVAWNYAAPEQAGSPIKVTFRFEGMEEKRALISRVDGDHGDFHDLYQRMGSPRYPTVPQIRELRRAAELPAAEDRKLENGELNLVLPAHGLAMIEVK
jgi:xylan 1,4-beta-xylosidase